jgi:conjugative transfer signal peptidase TraF
VKRVIVALIGLGLVVAQAGVLGFRFNLTKSLPLGVYRVTSAPPARGSIAQVCLPPRVAEFARGRGYLGPGKCPGRVRPLGKVVLAIRGDVVRLEPEGIRLNGEPVPDSRVVRRDSQGRTIAPHHWGTYRLGSGELWLFSGRHSAYDSRYFGPVHEEHMVAVLQPWWVWR